MIGNDGREYSGEFRDGVLIYEETDAGSLAR